MTISKNYGTALKCDNFYRPDHERGIAFDDPALGINWHVRPDQWILSDKDRNNPRFNAAELPEFGT